MPSALAAQFGKLRELLDAFGVPRFEVPGFEADDVLATLCRTLRERHVPVLILSGDRDLLQLALGSVEVLFLGARGRKPVVYDELQVKRRFSLGPGQLPALAALIGDASDNLPGVPGVGAKTATLWLQKYGNIADLLEHSSELAPERLQRALLTHAEQIRRNETLATLRTDVPLPPGPVLGRLLPEALERVRAVFVELEFKSLLPRLDAIL